MSSQVLCGSPGKPGSIMWGPLCGMLAVDCLSQLFDSGLGRVGVYPNRDVISYSHLPLCVPPLLPPTPLPTPI